MALLTYALCTPAQLKSYLGIPTATTQDDAKFELFINAATDAIENFCDRKLVSRGTLTELQHGRRSNIIITREFPIISIAEVRQDYNGIFTDAATLIDPIEYQIADTSTSICLLKSHFASGYNNVQVKYDAGYVVIPSDLVLACIWYVEWIHLARNRQDMGRTNVSKGDESYTVDGGMPAKLALILTSYKRCDFPLISSPVSNV